MDSIIINVILITHYLYSKKVKLFIDQYVVFYLLLHCSHICVFFSHAGLFVSVQPLLTSAVPVIVPVMHPAHFPSLKHFRLKVSWLGQNPLLEPSPAELSIGED